MLSVDKGLFDDIYQDTDPIAITGAGCRFMGASDPFTFWRRIAEGQEFTRPVTRDDLLHADLDPGLLDRADYVPVASVVDDAEFFDADWFGYSPAEASSIDPQQRLFLTCAWEALEMAGIAQHVRGKQVGVFGAARMSTYYLPERENVLEAGLSHIFQRLVNNDKDYIASRVAYKLGLTGPALSIQTACSSSLVAVHVACEQLRSGECDWALAGGAALTFPMAAGYLHQPGMIFSPDGKCRPFDASAQGTFIGNGVAVVLLKPLRRALQDGDGVLAVIRGSAVNNDGVDKAGFTAPSVQGQAAVIREALALSDVPPQRLGYIEAHGTATPLGDPIEIQALCEAFDDQAGEGGRCALGSLKANTGHLDTAAGVSSLLKAAFAVRTGLIPPCLHFNDPNPAIEMETTPFFVPNTLRPWSEERRTAGVSSFGIGGTNCHMIVESLPQELAPPKPRNGEALKLTLSARTPTDLAQLATNHAEALLDGMFDEKANEYCNTVSNRRSAMEFSLDLEAADISELAGKLLDITHSDLSTHSPQPAKTASSSNGALSHVIAPIAILKGQRFSKPSSKVDHWDLLVEQIGTASTARAGEHDWSSLPEETEAVNKLHAIYVSNALNQLGLFKDEAEYSLDQVMQQGMIHADYRQLMGRLLRDLVVEGSLLCDQGKFLGLQVKPLAQAKHILAEMKARGYDRLSDMAERVGPKLAAMLRGDVDPVSQIFPSAETDDVEEMYERQRDSIYLNDLLADGVSAYIHQLPSSPSVRILEVGAGTGGTTSAVLPVLPKSRTTYTFTDIGALFLSRAATKFADFPSMQFATFDIEAEPSEQGFADAAYDIIIAANVLHNGRDLKSVFKRIRRLLAPGGMLILREISAPKPLFDFIFGPLVPVLEDYEERGDELFPSLDRWGQFLIAAGFSHWAAFPQKGCAPMAIGESVIVAQNGAFSEARQSESTRIDTSSGGDLVVALASRGEKFWRYEHIALRPAKQNIGHVSWSEESGVVTFGDEETKSIITAVRADPSATVPPTFADQIRTEFTGGIATALNSVLGDITDAQGITCEAMAGSCPPLPQRGCLETLNHPSGGRDIAFFDDDGWPLLWIKNLTVERESETRPALYSWAWQPLQPASARARISAILAPSGTSALAGIFGQEVCAGWVIPDHLCEGEICVLDLSTATIVLEELANIGHLIENAIRRGIRLCIVTHNVLAITPWDSETKVHLTGLAGLVRVARTEYRSGGTCWIDLDDTDTSTAKLTNVLSESEEVMAIRHGRAFVPRLHERGRITQHQHFQAEGLHILFAGLSPLALSTAAWLADQGAGAIWLVARREPKHGEFAQISALRERKVEVELWDDVDLEKSKDVERVLEAASRRGKPLSSIFHYGGYLHDTPIAGMDKSKLRQVSAPKLQVAEVIVDWLPRLHPQHVVFASSAATVFGPAGQALHAMVNSALESLAAQAAADGWPVKAIAWGYWDDGRVERANIAHRLADQGMLSMTPGEALSLLSGALSMPQAVLAAAKVDWDRLAWAGKGNVPRSLKSLCSIQRVTGIETSTNRVDKVSASAWLTQRIAELVGRPNQAMELDVKMIDIGLDSMMMLEIHQQFKAKFGCEVATEDLVQHDTIRSLGRHLDSLVTSTGNMQSSDDLAHLIRGHVAQLLMLPEVEIGINRKLLELGLDSLLFLDLAERVFGDTGIRISGETAMQSDTISALAAAVWAEANQDEKPIGPILEALKTASQGANNLLLDNGSIAPHAINPDDRFPLSALQRAWWLGRGADQPFGNTAKHLYVEYDQPEPAFDLESFERAWNLFVQRHAALRMGIDESGEAFVRDEVPAYEFARDDYRNASEAVQAHALAETRDRMSHQMFDLTQWPVFEWRVSLLANDKIRLHLDIDTTFLDIESFQIMLRELGRHTENPDRELPPLSLCAADYMRATHIMRSTPEADIETAAYKRLIEQSPSAPNLPLIANPSNLTASHFDILRQALSRDEWLEAKDIAGSQGVGGTALLMSAFAVALSAWTGAQTAFTLQLLYTDRKPIHSEIMNIACEASASMPVPFDFSADPCFLDVIEETEQAIQTRLDFHLIDGQSVYQENDTNLSGIPNLRLPVVFTSLLGVRQAYALPESADPLLGMPSYEYAAQPQILLNFQALEEERELLYNLDQRNGVLPDNIAEAVMSSFAEIVRSDMSVWSRPISSILPSTSNEATGLWLLDWLEAINAD